MAVSASIAAAGLSPSVGAAIKASSPHTAPQYASTRRRSRLLRAPVRRRFGTHRRPGERRGLRCVVFASELVEKLAEKYRLTSRTRDPDAIGPACDTGGAKVTPRGPARFS